MASGPSAAERLILALDVPNQGEAERLVEELEGLVSFFKVGLGLLTATGLDVVRELIGRGKKVFLDGKWFDIPETVAAAVGAASELGASFATIDGNGDSAMLRAAASARGPRGPGRDATSFGPPGRPGLQQSGLYRAGPVAGGGDLRLLCVTALTSWDDEVLREMGWGTTTEKLVAARVRRAIESGLDGAVCSGREAAMVREIAGRDFLIVTPGMRLEAPGRWTDSGSVDRLRVGGPTPRADHKRASDPESAVRDGADYIVVGRPIRDAQDRRREARRYIEAIERGLSLRVGGPTPGR